MYLMLSVAGHLTIFLARTRGPFWSIRPARILWMAVVGTQTLATLIAVFGIFMTPLGWGWAALVWGYAFVWFLVTDRVKLLAYRILDPVKQVAVKGKPMLVAATAVPGGGAGPDRPAAVATKVRTKVRVAAFHTDTDPEEPVYHDRSDCPYGQEIKGNGNDKPGRAGRRRCDWCTHA
jgi:H+-transporting ATPase